MEKLEKYLNHCYWEHNKKQILVYKLIKVDGKYGLIFHEAWNDDIYVYNDFGEDLSSEDLTDYLCSYIPELDSTCISKEISEGHYIELTSRIEKLKKMSEKLKKQINKFIKTGGLGEEI